MGTGIMAAIPLSFIAYEHYEFDQKYLAQRVSDNFDTKKTGGKETYVIKEDLLLRNYKSFLAEFYTLIEENLDEHTGLSPDEIPEADNFGEFLEIFSEKNRNTLVPFVPNYSDMFSVADCESGKYWLFYNGSYKAYLEEYSTLVHFERVLAKAMNNPLANTVRFGIFG